MTTTTAIDQPDPQPSPLLNLAGPYGAVGPVRRVNTYGWLPNDCAVYTCAVGNPSAVSGPYRGDARTASGTGRAWRNPDHARLIAVAEAMERYAGLLPRVPAVVAPARALGADALDLALLPRCSKRELNRPGCPLRTAHPDLYAAPAPASHPDPDAPLRWVQATDLRTGAAVLVPAVLVHLTYPELPGEDFWIPVSTGCAVHATEAAATVNAILELIERDAIALTWLLRRPIPRLGDERLSPAARSILAWCADRGVHAAFYDATTDLGIPVVICLATADHTPRTAQLVGAASGFDLTALTEHALLEALGLRGGIESRRALPRRYADHRSVSDGAAVMAARRNRSAFEHLDGSPASLLPHHDDPGSDEARLKLLLNVLEEAEMTVLRADLTVRELRDIGHVAVRVIVPELQPMSVRPLVQYRAHARLKNAATRLGLKPVPTGRLNSYPQPMA